MASKIAARGAETGVSVPVGGEPVRRNGVYRRRAGTYTPTCREDRTVTLGTSLEDAVWQGAEILIRDASADSPSTTRKGRGDTGRK